jgi:hypothetical protein
LRLEGLAVLKIFHNLIGIETRDLLPYSMAPEPAYTIQRPRNVLLLAREHKFICGFQLKSYSHKSHLTSFAPG